MTGAELDLQWAGIRHKTKLLILETEDFIVIVDQDERVYWETVDSYDAKGGHKDMRAWNDFLNRSAYVEITPCGHLNAATRLDFKRLIAEATARALDNDFANTEKMLVDAIAFVTKRNQETSRLWYLSASGTVTAIVLLFGAVFWLCRTDAIASMDMAAFYVVISAVAGVVGAMLSIILRMGKAHLDCSSGRKLHYFEAVSRVAAGCISGAIMYLAIKAGVVGVAVLDAPNSISGQLLLAFVAGASERWMPSIISKFDESAKE